MRITIHQPEHMPWLGFFHKMNMAEVFVLLDSVQFRKDYFQNRNRIRTLSGSTWVTVPVRHDSRSSTLIKDMRIVNEQRWKKKWLSKVLSSYKKTEYFDRYFDKIRKVLMEDYEYLSQLNISMIQLLAQFLGLDRSFLLSSELAVTGKASELNLSICKEVGADIYVSGISGKDYLNLQEFANEKIEVIFQEFHHPIYMQQVEPFVPCMSVLDLLFNYGDKSLDVINGIGVPVIEDIFL